MKNILKRLPTVHKQH